MPNHCNNTVSFVGSVEDVTRLIETVKSDNRPFSFDAIVPYPKEYKDLDIAANEYEKEHGMMKRCQDGIKDGFNSGGYDWCLANWDTKWDAYDFNEKEITENSISFCTAWSPPINVIRELGNLFPNVQIRLEFHELGMMFMGSFEVFQGSEELEEREITKDDMIDFGYDFEEDEETVNE
jgi:hypothetical protein